MKSECAAEPGAHKRSWLLRALCGGTPSTQELATTFLVVLCASDFPKQKVLPLSFPLGTPARSRDSNTVFGRPALQTQGQRKERTLDPTLTPKAEKKPAPRGDSCGPRVCLSAPGCPTTLVPPRTSHTAPALGQMPPTTVGLGRDLLTVDSVKPPTDTASPSRTW